MRYSDRMALYLNQTAQLQRQTEADGYGNMQYSAPQTIKARKEGRTQMVRDTNGETVASSTTLFTLERVSPMDKIDGVIVINSMSMVDRYGNIVGWEAYL